MINQRAFSLTRKGISIDLDSPDRPYLNMADTGLVILLKQMPSIKKHLRSTNPRPGDIRYQESSPPHALK